MSYRRLLCAVLPLLFVSCVGLPVALSSVEWGVLPTGFGTIGWSRITMPSGALALRLENSSSSSVDIRISVPPLTIGTRTTYKRQQIGVEEVEYCDPVTQECFLVEEPVYELVSIEEPVLADLRVAPNRVTLAPHESAVVTVVRAPAQSDLEYTAAVAIRIAGSPRDRQIIEFDFTQKTP